MYMIYDVDVDPQIVASNLHRIINQIYRLLPLREEGSDWKKPLYTLIIELTGLIKLFPDIEEGLRALSKLQGVYSIGEELDFYEYRRTIFECCSIIGSIEKKITE